MPLREEPNEMDLVSLATVDGLEIIETIDRFESVVIGELLLGDGFLGLQTQDSIDVFFLLYVWESTP
jgi:hypothetical protein